MNLSKRMWVVLYEAPNGRKWWLVRKTLAEAQAEAERVHVTSNLPPLVFEAQTVTP